MISYRISNIFVHSSHLAYLFRIYFQWPGTLWATKISASLGYSITWIWDRMTTLMDQMWHISHINTHAMSPWTLYIGVFVSPPQILCQPSPCHNWWMVPYEDEKCHVWCIINIISIKYITASNIQWKNKSYHRSIITVGKSTLTRLH